MILFPYAKINLGLFVTGKRADGFHSIESCMCPIPLCDILEILPADHFVLKTTGFEIDGSMDNNLCVRAFRLMQDNFDIGDIYMHLRKMIPMGAGLGGGSSDAAFVLGALNSIFHLNLSDQELRDLAIQLGSDCPFFITDGPQIASGRGEVLSPLDIDLRGYYLKIIHPGIHISTKEAYSKVNLSTPDIDWSRLSEFDFDYWREHLRNDFETHIFNIHPELDEIKQNLYDRGALYASMSGSGSTMYGIFRHKPETDNSYGFERVLQL